MQLLLGWQLKGLLTNNYMLNLLLRENRHKLRDEYFLRLIITSIFLAIIVMIIWLLLLFASYIQITVEQKLVDNQMLSIENSDLTKQRREWDDIAESVKEKISHISDTKEDYLFVLKYVVEDSVSGIGLNTIEVIFNQNDSGENIASITLYGVSNTRNDLVVFRNLLSQKEIFKTVNIPTSNFTQSKDVPFTVSITTVPLVNL